MKIATWNATQRLGTLAKPAERGCKLAHAGGLLLLVQSNGFKLWLGGALRESCALTPIDLVELRV